MAASTIRNVLTIGTHIDKLCNMKTFRWNDEKNKTLQRERDLSFEQVVYYIDSDCVLDIIMHPNQNKYRNQRVYIILMNDYVYLVPFIDKDDERFLKTIIPSRKFTKLYREGKIK